MVRKISKHLSYLDDLSFCGFENDGGDVREWYDSNEYSSVLGLDAYKWQGGIILNVRYDNFTDSPHFDFVSK